MECSDELFFCAALACHRLAESEALTSLQLLAIRYEAYRSRLVCILCHLALQAWSGPTGELCKIVIRGCEIHTRRRLLEPPGREHT